MLSVQPTATATSRFLPTPDVIATTLHNSEMVLLHLATQRYYTLNETGSQIWQGITAGLAATAIEERLTDRYHVTTAQAHAAVAELLADLLAETLVQPVEEQAA